MWVQLLRNRITKDVAIPIWDQIAFEFGTESHLGLGPNRIRVWDRMHLSLGPDRIWVWDRIMKIPNHENPKAKSGSMQKRDLGEYFSDITIKSQNV